MIKLAFTVVFAQILEHHCDISGVMTSLPVHVRSDIASHITGNIAWVSPLLLVSAPAGQLIDEEGQDLAAGNLPPLAGWGCADNLNWRI